MSRFYMTKGKIHTKGGELYIPIRACEITVHVKLASSVHTLKLCGGVAQWVARLTRNVEIADSSPTKGPRCFHEQETLPLLLSTGWFQERIRA